MNPSTSALPVSGSNQEQPGGVKIILMLYDGALSYLKTASKYALAGDVAQKNIYIHKTLDIIDALEGHLDMELGGDIARNLSRLYTFMREHLKKSLDTQDPKFSNEVIQLLDNLRDSWQAVEDSLGQASA